MAEPLVEFPDIQRVLPDHTVGHVVGIAVPLVFLTQIEDVGPFLGAVFDLCPALSGKGENALSVIVDPQIPHLLLQILYLFLHPTVQLLPEPSQELVPGVELQRRNLDE